MVYRDLVPAITGNTTKPPNCLCRRAFAQDLSLPTSVWLIPPSLPALPALAATYALIAPLSLTSLPAPPIPGPASPPSRTRQATSRPASASISPPRQAQEPGSPQLPPPAAAAAAATTSPAIHLISRASRACRSASHFAKFGLPLGPQRLNVGFGCERRQRGLDSRQASLDVKRRQVGRHRLPREPVPVRLWTCSRTWAPLRCDGKTRRPDLTRPRCTHRGRPFDTPPF